MITDVNPRGRSTRAATLLVLGALADACENHERPARRGPETPVDSASAVARLQALRQRFGGALLRPGVVTRWQSEGADHVHPVVRSSTPNPATVRIPMRANGTVELTDVGSQVAIRFRLRGSTASALTTKDDVALYPRAHESADLLYRIRADGLEDFVVFDDKPEVEQLIYDVELSSVGGLRLVDGTLEFLDTSGVPRLRVAPPLVIDERGDASPGTLALRGCDADRSPLAP